MLAFLPSTRNGCLLSAANRWPRLTGKALGAEDQGEGGWDECFFFFFFFLEKCFDMIRSKEFLFDVFVAVFEISFVLYGGSYRFAIRPTNQTNIIWSVLSWYLRPLALLV